ncbi:hypothetical protein GCM10011504_56250 [Siccirubricoccus deserti]|nr:hypothetical protein GCM10011504_56250 [Siccirubricoccus deserti]
MTTQVLPEMATRSDSYTAGIAQAARSSSRLKSRMRDTASSGLRGEVREVSRERRAAPFVPTAAAALEDQGATGVIIGAGLPPPFVAGGCGSTSAGM